MKMGWRLRCLSVTSRTILIATKYMLFRAQDTRARRFRALGTVPVGAADAEW
jgi:hypothetical protein